MKRNAIRFCRRTGRVPIHSAVGDVAAAARHAVVQPGYGGQAKPALVAA